MELDIFRIIGKASCDIASSAATLLGPAANCAPDQHWNTGIALFALAALLAFGVILSGRERRRRETYLRR